MTRTKLFACVVALTVALPFGAAAEDAPGWFKIPGTDSTIKFNGFAEMVYVYEFGGGQGGAELYNNPAGIPFDNTAGTKQSPDSLGFGVLYSRFGFMTNTPSGVGTIGTRIEGDFNAAASNKILEGNTFTHSNAFRVRHAYGTVGDFLLLGQTWSTFADLAAFPDQQDENPVPNLAPLRAPMVRVTFPAGPTKISIAAEDPYAITSNTSTFTGVPGFYYTIPDFIARLDIPAAGIGSFSVRAVTRQFKNSAPLNHSAQGFGGAVGAALKIGGDSLVLDGSVGMGMGPYQSGTFFDAVDIGTDIKLLTSFAGSAGYTHVWNSQFRSNLILSGVWASENNDIRNAAIAAGGATAATYFGSNKAVYSGAFNTYWSVARNFWVGAEFWYNMRQTFASVAGQSAYGHEARGEITTHFDFF